MKNKFTFLSLIILLVSSINSNAATAVCTCKNGKQVTEGMDLGQDPKPICEGKCKRVYGVGVAEGGAVKS